MGRYGRGTRSKEHVPRFPRERPKRFPFELALAVKVAKDVGGDCEDEPDHASATKAIAAATMVKLVRKMRTALRRALMRHRSGLQG